MGRILLGGPIFEAYKTPGEWVKAMRREGYAAAYCPVQPDASPDEIKAFRAAAEAENIVIAEVGAWSNPLAAGMAGAEAREKCQRSLELAERIGARCCVNISGARGEKWDGPHPLNLTPQTFDLIVTVTRAIIDAVQPGYAKFALETMPWAYPDSTESYGQLLQAIDRPGFGVHFDPVNLVNSPGRYYGNAALMEEFVRALGPHIVSCHAKDIILHATLTTHLDEICPGQGGLDYGSYLNALVSLEPDVPLMLEHLGSAEEYRSAATYVRQVAREQGVALAG